MQASRIAATCREHDIEAALCAAVTARARCRSQLNQRWRERPRCPALRLTPGAPRRGRSRHRWSCRMSLSARAVRAGRTRRPRARFAWSRFVRTNAADEFSGNRFAHVPTFFRQTRPRFSRRDRAAHHRADDAGAVLGVVNALRFASTRPVAGPSGIDDACARHALATTRWWSSDDGSQRC